ncbi:MAG TPA: GNAT family N-acetyltransferase [Streptosporangiaceae bacterium]|jgi:phosphinothricin acetyltransferase
MPVRADLDQIRPAAPDDLTRLTEIYNHYVTETPITFDIAPFTVEQRRAWFDAHTSSGPHRLLVADADGRPAGYATSSAFRPKAAYATSVEFSVYCAPEATGRGIGTALYDALVAALSAEDVHRAYAGVTLPNEASLRLHHRCGFRDIGTYEQVGRKFGRYWDVAWMERPLNG